MSHFNKRKVSPSLSICRALCGAEVRVVVIHIIIYTQPIVCFHCSFCTQGQAASNKMCTWIEINLQ